MDFLRRYAETLFLAVMGVVTLVAIYLLPGCAHVNHGPAVSVCLPDGVLAQCVDRLGLPYVATSLDGLVCAPQDDFEALLNYSKNGNYPAQKATQEEATSTPTMKAVP